MSNKNATVWGGMGLAVGIFKGTLDLAGGDFAGGVLVGLEQAIVLAFNAKGQQAAFRGARIGDAGIVFAARVLAEAVDDVAIHLQDGDVVQNECGIFAIETVTQDVEIDEPQLQFLGCKDTMAELPRDRFG